MRRSIITFLISAIVIVTTVAWAVYGNFTWDVFEIVPVAVILFVVGFAIYRGIATYRSAKNNEPIEDELSKKILVRAAAFSFHISLYVWLVLMYFSDKIALESHSLIGAGILGMAVVFCLSWIFVRLMGIKNG